MTTVFAIGPANAAARRMTAVSQSRQSVRPAEPTFGRRVITPVLPQDGLLTDLLVLNLKNLDKFRTVNPDKCRLTLNGEDYWLQRHPDCSFELISLNQIAHKTHENLTLWGIRLPFKITVTRYEPELSIRLFPKGVLYKDQMIQKTQIVDFAQLVFLNLATAIASQLDAGDYKPPKSLTN